MDTSFDIPTSTIIEHFDTLEDPRIERTKLHPLLDIITLTICAVICGAEGPSDIEQYGYEKYDWLKTFLTLPNGVPSHDTIGRVLARIDPKQFQSCFLHWIRDICQLRSREVVPIDGKTLRHSYDRELGQSAIHMVSAWAASNRLVLGQVKVSAKSNEITAIPELLDVLDIAECIVTIDAIGCQKDFAVRIVEKDADYVLALKGNQEHLYEDVKQLFDRLESRKSRHQHLIIMKPLRAVMVELKCVDTGQPRHLMHYAAKITGAVCKQLVWSKQNAV